MQVLQDQPRGGVFLEAGDLRVGVVEIHGIDENPRSRAGVKNTLGGDPRIPYRLHDGVCHFRGRVKSRQDDTAGKSSRERQAPALYAAVRVRHLSYGVSRIPRFVAGRITGHRRSLPQPSSAAWCPRLLTRAEVKDLHTAAY